MKNISFLLILVFLYSCQGNEESKKAGDFRNSLFSMTFRDFKEIDILRDYEKISDTLIFTGGPEEDYRILELREENDHLVVFYKVVDRDSLDMDKFSYRILDTLQINDLKERERISIGYCYNSAFYEGEIIGLVKKNDSLQVPEIIRVWRANPETESVEEVEEFGGITCLNESYSSNGNPVSLKDLDLRSRTK